MFIEDMTCTVHYLSTAATITETKGITGYEHVLVSFIELIVYSFKNSGTNGKMRAGTKLNEWEHFLGCYNGLNCVLPKRIH